MAAVIGRTVSCFRAHNTAVLDDEVKLAAGSAVRASCADFRDFPLAVGISSLQAESAGGTGCRAVSAALTAGLFPVLTERSIDKVERACAAAHERPVSGNVMACADAALAVDAF